MYRRGTLQMPRPLWHKDHVFRDKGKAEFCCFFPANSETRKYEICEKSLFWKISVNIYKFPPTLLNISPKVRLFVSHFLQPTLDVCVKSVITVKICDVQHKQPHILQMSFSQENLGIMPMWTCATYKQPSGSFERNCHILIDKHFLPTM